MHTLVIVICGFVLFGLFVSFGWLWHIGQFPSPLMTELFIFLWVAISFINMWIGISKAGYSVSEELFVLPQVLLPPLIVAGLVLLVL